MKFGETKRGVRKIQVEGVDGELKNYSIPYGKHVVVHEGDKITAGTSLCEGSISPVDILKILGPNKVREYLVDQIQEVYRLQGVKIDDKHIEVIVRQMMQKVSIDDVGDSNFLPKDRINRAEFIEMNSKLQDMVFVTNSGGIALGRPEADFGEKKDFGFENFQAFDFSRSAPGPRPTVPWRRATLI